MCGLEVVMSGVVAPEDKNTVARAGGVDCEGAWARRSAGYTWRGSACMRSRSPPAAG